MLETITLEGKNKEELLNNYLSENNITENDIFYKESETQGSLFKAKKVNINILLKSDVIKFIKDYVNKLSYYMNITINTEVREKDNIFTVILVTDNNPIIIGKDGRTLNSIQHLIRQTIINQVGFNVKVNVDASNYKSKKVKNLEFEIKKLAKEVLTTKIDVKLDPMNSYERRIVHSIIGEYDNLETESIGEQPNRYVVIKYKED